jgi:hypothetical protein
MRKLWPILSVLNILIVFGCATFNPRPIDEALYRNRSLTKSDGEVQVTADVLGAEETKKVFGFDLYKKGIQPIWIEIENNEKEPVWFLPVGLDPNYYSALEAAFVNHFNYLTPANEEMNRQFFKRRQVVNIGPGNIRSGFVYTPVDEGTKEFTVDLMSEDHQVRTFTFFINVPGLRIDHHEVKFEALYSKDEVVSYPEEGLRKALESLPCCTTNKNGTEQGDPLNIVVIGDSEDVLHTFIRAGWDETETIYSTSALKTATSFLFGGRYR